MSKLLRQKLRLRTDDSIRAHHKCENRRVVTTPWPLCQFDTTRMTLTVLQAATSFAASPGSATVTTGLKNGVSNCPAKTFGNSSNRNVSVDSPLQSLGLQMAR